LPEADRVLSGQRSFDDEINRSVPGIQAMSYRPDDPRARLGRALLGELGHTEERRTQPRFYAPTLVVTIDSETYRTVDWGLGACVLGDYDGKAAVDAIIALKLARPGDAATVHSATGRVLRVDPVRRQLTIQFAEIGPGMLGWLGDLRLSEDP
jgi:hypothetical protein